jgi:VWFA-related protein
MKEEIAMSLCRPAFAALVCAAVLGSGIVAQEAPKSTAGAAPDTASQVNQPQTKIVSRSDLVLVPVIVTDKKGQPLTGVAKDAFRVEEEGKDQEISIFEEVKTNNVVSKPAQAATDPDTANFASGSVSFLRLTVVVLDLVNTPYLRQQAAKQALMKYLSQSLQRDEPTTLLGLDRSGLHELHPFTTDTAVLIAALKKVEGQYTSGEASDSMSDTTDDLTADLQNSADSTAQQIVQFMQNSDATIAAAFQRDAIRQTLEAFNEIGHAYSAVPGRKALIWASAGFPFMINDPQAFNNMGLNMVEEYEKTWRTLMSANIAVYPIDVVGLVNTGFSMGRNGMSSGSGGRGGSTGSTGSRSSKSSSGQSGFGSSRNFPMNNNPIPYDRHAEQQEAMRAFADATGGRSCLDTNGLEQCFADAVKDARTYYLLGYYLGSDDHKPGWRKLKVKVAAEGAHARAREGFYVSAPYEDSPENRRKQISDALLSPIAYTGVRLKIRALNDDPAKAGANVAADGKRTTNFALTIPADNFAPDRVGNQALDLEIAAVAFDKNGKPADQDFHSASFKLNSVQLSAFAQTGLRVKEVLNLAPGSYQLRFAVRDDATGQVGTVILPLNRN